MTTESLIVPESTPAPKPRLYSLINPSDRYTFYAPNIEIAAMVVCSLSTSYGAQCVDVDNDDQTPVFFGWKEWLAEHKVDEAFCKRHALDVAAALDSLAIVDAAERPAYESGLASCATELDKRGYAAKWHDKNRSSMADIRARAVQIASVLRARVKSGFAEPAVEEGGDNVPLV